MPGLITRSHNFEQTVAVSPFLMLFWHSQQPDVMDVTLHAFALCHLFYHIFFLKFWVSKTVRCHKQIMT